MNEGLSFEDIKRQHIPIPESVVRDVKEVERLLKMEYISKEQAEKYLEKIEEDFRKLHNPEEKISNLEEEGWPETSPIDWEYVNRRLKEGKG